jgi:hypothetical protein
MLMDLHALIPLIQKSVFLEYRLSVRMCGCLQEYASHQHVNDWMDFIHIQYLRVNLRYHRLMPIEHEHSVLTPMFGILLCAYINV